MNMPAKRRAWLKKLHPKNSLFGRIFIWFWLAIIFMIIAAFTVGRYIGQTWDVSAPSASQVEAAKGLQSHLQALTKRNQEIERSLRRVGTRGQWKIFVIDEAQADLILGFPRPLMSQGQRFFSLIDSQPLLVRTSNMEFIGPLIITTKDKRYHMFAGKLLPREERPSFVFGSALAVFLAIGTLAVLVISFTIVKPIKRLGKLSNDFASGNMVAPDPHLHKRHDELGQLHNDIYQMATKLARSLAQQKALMANVSHELRTPLTRMQLAVAMLTPQSDAESIYAERIEKEIRVMDDLIGQALQLAKLDATHQNAIVQLQMMTFSHVMGPLLDDLSFEAEASSKTLTINDIPTLELQLNPSSFVSAIENVTRNAIKYCRSTVKIAFSVDGAQNTLSICIEDDGEGLSESERAHIFEPFYRAAPGKNQQGTGLGLAITKAAVELHKGDIQVYQSALGGLSIALRFPIEPSN